MAFERRIGSKVSKSVRAEESLALRIDPYPYIGVVKNNLDSIRCGRLQVWVPDLGGDPDEPKNWRTVSYASPFMGTTNLPRNSDTTNSFDNTSHTYGMWMVPPDIGVEVLILFVGGDPTRGYWFACVNSNLSRHMMPGMAASTNIQESTADAGYLKGRINGVPYPVAEFNENDPKSSHNANFANNPKPIHEYQARILREQGLDRDDIRGTVSSSSQRESPSSVFGISTPGRPKNDPADDPQFLDKLKTGTVTQDDYAVKTRTGGHTFIMDDGTSSGTSQLVRLRTAKGHQIMMHDSADTLYIANARGSVWLEMSGDSLNVYSAGDISIRSNNNLNLHADNDINVNAGGKFNVSATGAAQIDAAQMNFRITNNFTVATESGTIGLNASNGFNVQAGTISLDAKGRVVVNGLYVQNTVGGAEVKKPEYIPRNKLPDTLYEDTTGLYKIKPNTIDTIVTVAPGHEPFYLRDVPGTLAFFTDITKKAQASFKPQAPVNGKGTQPGPERGGAIFKMPNGVSIKNPATDKELRKQKPVKGKIGPLDSDQLTALFAQIGQSESSSNYQSTNTIGFIGKYQFGRAALTDLELVKPLPSTVKGNGPLQIDSNWVGGGNKPGSRTEFLNNEEAQEEAMFRYTEMNYKRLTRNGVITTESTPEEVAGWLSTAHLLGSGGPPDSRSKDPEVRQYGSGAWRVKYYGTGQDQNKTTGVEYFQRGKYAISVLAPRVATLDQAPITG